MGGRLKRKPLPDEEQVAGVIVHYDEQEGKGRLDIGSGEVIFSRQVLQRAGHTRIMVGARMECCVVPNGGGKEVVCISMYTLPKHSPPLSRRQRL